MSRVLLGLAAVGWLLAPAAHAEEPFAIDLTVRCGKASQTAHAESAARLAKPKERGVLKVKAGERITVRWQLAGTDRTATLKDVTVHFFAVKEEKAGQQSVPKLDKDVIAESALNMDFGPKDKNEGELSFTIDKAGCYLLRLETIGAIAGPAGHEDFAALDVEAR
ncbi:MAG TPA: hypothetical protein VFW33_04905 [Gemmataceae bacterium]|nr:hypothetical protein [Gemmataceae bacterium]